MGILVKHSNQRCYISEFPPVPGTSKRSYVLTNVNIDNQPMTTTNYSEDSMISIKLYGIDLKVTANWLYNYARYNITFSSGYEHHIKDLEFLVAGSVIQKSSYILRPRFNPPIEFKIDEVIFRLIPFAPNYAMNKNCDILELSTLSYIYKTVNEDIQKNIYKTIRLNGIQFQMHVLVAVTWVDNDDFTNKYYIDHINGIKGDYRIENLRWVSVAENNQATVDQQIRIDTDKCLVKNLVTGEEMVYNSVTQACNNLGVSRITSSAVKLGKGKPYILKINDVYYQLKYADDDLPWSSLAEGKFLYKRSEYNSYDIIVTTKDAAFRFDNLKDISAFIGDGEQYISLFEAINNIREYKIGTVQLERKMNSNTTNYIAHNVKTGEVVYSKGLGSYEVITGVTKSSINKSMNNNGAYIYNDWRFKADDGLDFSEPKDIANRPVMIRVSSPNGEEHKDFPSLRSAAAYLNVDKKTVKKALLNKTTIYDCKITEV